MLSSILHGLVFQLDFSQTRTGPENPAISPLFHKNRSQKNKKSQVHKPCDTSKKITPLSCSTSASISFSIAIFPASTKNQS